MTNTEEATLSWWQDTGASQLNKELIELRNKGIGSVPISNLELSTPPLLDKRMLAELITNDGIRAVVYNYGNDTDVVVKI